MITKIEFERFKNFKKACLELGPLTLLIGSNASGKSNIRDAFRFLHGIARGYNLAEIMGEKYVEGGVLQWRGIRGGTREVAYMDAESFSLTVDFEIVKSSSNLQGFFPFNAKYSIEINPGIANSSPIVQKESLYIGKKMMFDSHPDEKSPIQKDDRHLIVKIPAGGKYRRGHTESFIAYQPVITQIAERIENKRKDKAAREAVHFVKETISAFNDIRFLDLDPDAMRVPSLPGQFILGDRGENLSSVLHSICEDPIKKKALIEWIKELTPMDATDFEFIPDQSGKILVNLVEKSERKTSAYSASDGTLRFLSMIAALLGPKPAKLYFFEEIDNGLHPARLYLLLQLVQSIADEGKIQMVATSHSPQLLRALGDRALKDASLVFRKTDAYDAGIKKIIEMPEIQKILATQDLARLHESGWFEDAMFFSGDGEAA
jgi:predicted ATPase